MVSVDWIVEACAYSKWERKEFAEQQAGVQVRPEQA